MDPHHLVAGITLSKAEHEARVLSRFECAEILELEGHPIGLFKVLREPGEWRLVQVQIVPSQQRAGIGGHLIGSLVAEARTEGVALSLSVLKANPARRLYERLGFVVVSEGQNVLNLRTGG